MTAAPVSKVVRQHTSRSCALCNENDRFRNVQDARRTLVAAAAAPAVRPFHLAQQLAVCDLPDAHGPVRRRGAQQPPVARHVHSQDGRLMHHQLVGALVGQVGDAQLLKVNFLGNEVVQRRLADFGGRRAVLGGRRRGGRRHGLPPHFHETVAGTGDQPPPVGQETGAFYVTLHRGRNQPCMWQRLRRITQTCILLGHKQLERSPTFFPKRIV